MDEETDDQEESNEVSEKNVMADTIEIPDREPNLPTVEIEYVSVKTNEYSQRRITFKRTKSKSIISKIIEVLKNR